MLWSLANTWWDGRRYSKFLEHVQSSKFISQEFLSTSSLWCQCVLTYAGGRYLPKTSSHSGSQSTKGLDRPHPNHLPRKTIVGIPECDAGQNSNFSANLWLPGQLPEWQRVLPHMNSMSQMPDVEKNTSQNDTSKNNHATSNASPLSSLHKEKSSITIHFQTDVHLRKILKSRWGKFLGHLHVQQHESKHSTQGFLMAWLWTRLSSWQHSNQDQDILPRLSQPWQTSKNSPELGMRLSADRLFWQCLLQKRTKIRKCSGTFGDSIFFESTVQV